jgi:ribosomal 30S subunit maturation factor RimM
LRNTDLYIIASAAAPLDHDEYFIHDLPGMTVVDETGTVIGVVNDVITTGASDIIVIERPACPKHSYRWSRRLYATSMSPIAADDCAHPCLIDES